MWKSKGGCNREYYDVQIKGEMDKGGYYDVELKGGCKQGAMWKLKGWMDTGGHYDV